MIERACVPSTCLMLQVKILICGKNSQSLAGQTGMQDFGQGAQ